MKLTDRELLRAFESGRLTAFHHRDHLRLAWLRVLYCGAGAEDTVASDIRRFAARAGASAKYHETVTRFWVGLVRHADRALAPTIFEDLLAACPLLLDQRAPLRHWKEDTIWGNAARAGWTDPDLEPLPAE